MQTNSPMLRDLQRAICASLVAHDDGNVSAYIAGGSLSAAERLSIYRNTFLSVAANALRLSYPAIHRLVGAEFFDAAAHQFIAEEPPQSACLDDYGPAFGEFLARFGPAAPLAYLPDVARLEWAVNSALHAPDIEPLDLAQLAALSETDHPLVHFVLHPSVSVIRADYPVDEIWRGVLEQDDAALARIDLAAGGVWLLVERLPDRIATTRLSEPAWRFTTALCAGHPLHCAMDETPDVDAQALLADHLANGRFIGFEVVSDPAAKFSKGFSWQ